ncbi:hypothetical protein ACIRL3_15835 [Streptomyces sp. NPDC102384]|uniref:hypothetical protein n=1 Tax=unclassified Streptomyces TaxID=2593676 RepID=UPI00380260FF
MVLVQRRLVGLPARAARNTALMEALADLPSMVVADLFSIAPKTAERWASYLVTR